jgi:hypothetical protein
VEEWTSRDDDLLQKKAVEWRDALSEPLRTRIFNKYGVRWSEAWRIPGWTPSQQLVTDPMHCLLENLASHHFRDYLSLTSFAANNLLEKPPAFLYAFHMYNPSAQTSTMIRPESADIESSHIQKALATLSSASLEVLLSSPDIIERKLKPLRLGDLQFLCSHFGTVPKSSGRVVKADLIRALIDLVSSLSSSNYTSTYC